ncbi:DNA-binding domain-containing protein [Methylotenera sp.]|jgi:hypothetical protein|uniref:HvfC/BufC N-terminal domain-containing protein n=1 Tax=Methylotenera sp. TaxID=2051956 RepID=UPI0027305412|nr:DNA-binding domain-containing protein [Methylotenera sp.]MDP2230812.1 DNA-binding domain-containing protein [Methylotenera sp.]
MSDLVQIQSDFQAFLINNKNIAFTHQIVDDDKVGAKKRLSIYYDAYRLRIIEALATAYPKLKMLLGDDLFDKTAREYIDKYPSTYRNLRWYGGSMREHLLYTLPQHLVAAEMADFEWALSLAFDAEDVDELTLQNLGKYPPESWSDLSFKFQPSIQVIRTRWNIIPMWKALEAEEMPPALIQESTYQSWLIWRKNLNSQFRSMSEIEAVALNLGMMGATFGEICANLEDILNLDEATITAAQYLASWLEMGLISNVALIQFKK